jgi:hypothetical protein
MNLYYLLNKKVTLERKIKMIKEKGKHRERSYPKVTKRSELGMVVHGASQHSGSRGRKVRVGGYMQKNRN